ARVPDRRRRDPHRLRRRGEPFEPDARRAAHRRDDAPAHVRAAAPAAGQLMRILLTNDDGIASPALVELRRVLSPFGRVVTIAPDRNQSATSQSLTLHRPLRIHEVAEDSYSVDGTPTDCVLVAFHGQLGEPPDLVVSGINHGPNMGEDVFYSGTVAAAIEGSMQGSPALSVSLATRELTDFVAPASFV